MVTFLLVSYNLLSKTAQLFNTALPAFVICFITAGKHASARDTVGFKRQFIWLEKCLLSYLTDLVLQNQIGISISLALTLFYYFNQTLVLLC